MMLRRKRSGPQERDVAPSAAAQAADGGADANGRRLRSGLAPRRWRRRLAVAVLGLALPLGMLIGIELGLRAWGFGHPTGFCLLARDGKAWTDNRRFGWQFFSPDRATSPHPFAFPARKPAGTIRLFILGDSAAMGTPAPAFGFGRILEVMLDRRHPTRRFEVINAAMWGINSHVALPIARDCARHQPDLFILYMGNNETIGLYSPESGRPGLAAYPRLIRLRQGLKTWRVAQLAETGMRALVDTTAASRTPHDLAFFQARSLPPWAPERDWVRRNFRRNLADILQATLASGAKTVVATVAVNLKDFPPLASAHRPGLSAAELDRWNDTFNRGLEAESNGAYAQALAAYAGSAQIDDRFAELQFRLGTAALALGQRQAALDRFRLARDLDCLQFRTDSTLNAIARDLAAGREPEGLHFVDAEAAFAASALADGGVPGAQFFHEHVHFRFDGDYLLAATLLPAVERALRLESQGAPAPIDPPTRAECAAALAFTPWDELDTEAAMVRLTAKPPFTGQPNHRQRQTAAEQAIARRNAAFTTSDVRRTVAACREAIARRPGDWQLHFNLGTFLDRIHDSDAAIAEFEKAAALLPHAVKLRMALGTANMNAHRYRAALDQFEMVLELEPGHAAAREMAAQARVRLPPR